MKMLKVLTCEFLGTAFLLATVVGSGILAHNLDAGNIAVTVLSVAMATGCVLTALILTCGGVSAQFNPAVSLINALEKTTSWGNAFACMATQIAGAIFGVTAANFMFDLAPYAISHHARTGSGQWLAEFIATFGLILVVKGCGRNRPDALPFAVAAYVCGAILFTSSTCFANPAVTISRIFTDTITGITPGDVMPFIVCQIAGAISAFFLGRFLFSAPEEQVPTNADRHHARSKDQERELIAR